MEKTFFIAAVFALLLSRAWVSATLLSDLLESRNDTKLFLKASNASNFLANYLGDPLTSYTLFVPTDNAVTNSSQMMLYFTRSSDSPPAWGMHLLEACKNHIIEGEAMSRADIFDLTITELQTMRDPVTVSQWTHRIQDAHIVVEDIYADNGVMHVIDQVLRPNFFNESFAELELQEEYGPDRIDLNRTSLVTIADLTGARHLVLEQENPDGLTFLGCRIRAFNKMGLDYLPQSILGGHDAMHSEFLNESYANTTNSHHFEYSLIPQNYYLENVNEGLEELIFPVNPCAHMWVTVREGTLCFNDACVVATPYPRTYYASNGVGHVVDRCQVCPGIATMAYYAAERTKHNVKDVAQFFIASEWNLRNLSLSVGNGAKLTLFACLNEGWTDFNLEDVTRLSSDKWKPHLWDLLRHFLVEGEWTRENLIHFYQVNKGPYNITMLTGQNVLVDYDESRDMPLFGGAELYLADIKGLDGILHFTTEVNYPESMIETVYDVADNEPDYSIQINLIDAVQLREDMRRLSPLTALYAPNDKWQTKQFDLEEIAVKVLENHMFEDLLWCKDLRAMAGQRIESHNKETWLLSVNENNMPCFDTIAQFGGTSKRSCIVTCDILARNGLVHYLDELMLFEAPATVAPRPSTATNSTRGSTSSGSPDTANEFVISTPEDPAPTDPTPEPVNKSSSTRTMRPMVTLAVVFVALCSLCW